MGAARRRPDITRDAVKELEAARVLREHLSDLAQGDELFIRDSLEGETDLDGLVSTLVHAIGEDEAHAVGLKAYQDQISQRVALYGERAEFKRRLLVQALEISGRPTIETDGGTVTLRPVAPKVVEGEIADIPAEFWQPQPPKLDRRALLAALKEGRDVPGASLSNGGTTISIRRA